MTFKHYQYSEARAYAQAQANKLKIAHGIEWSKFSKVWIVRMLPRKENRYGCDLRCEVVEVDA